MNFYLFVNVNESNSLIFHIGNKIFLRHLKLDDNYNVRSS